VNCYLTLLRQFGFNFYYFITPIEQLPCRKRRFLSLQSLMGNYFLTALYSRFTIVPQRDKNSLRRSHCTAVDIQETACYYIIGKSLEVTAKSCV
jgi:hypothetical protein